MSDVQAPDLEVTVYGDVSGAFVTEVKETLSAAFAAMRRATPPRVGVRIVDGLLTLKELCDMERERSGRDRFGEEGYLTTHESVDDRPRITICWQRADLLPPVLAEAALQHEAGHAVLHAAPAFGEFAVSAGLLRSAREKGVSLPSVRTLVYLASQAVKDFEVSRLLADSGMRATQSALSVYLFAEIVRLRESWEKVSHRMDGRLVYLADHLRPVLYTEPLQSTDSNLSGISNAIGQALSELPEDVRELLIALSASLAENLGEATHENVERAALLLLELPNS